MIGQQVSRFRILSPLGAGAMGEVYLAEDQVLGRMVAIKFLARELLADPSALSRFRHEARNAAELSHSGIASLFEFGTLDDRPYIVLEYVPGETLSARLRRGKLAVDEVTRIGRLLAEALAAAHARKIIHRDLKPGNVMVLPDGSTKILDLGLSTKTDATRLTRSGVIPGTIAYMSPEQLSGNPADARSDLWSLGVVLYECLVGQLPFEAESAIGTLTRILSEDLVPVREHRRGIPTILDQTVARCLQKDPELRFQHADELAAQLRMLESQLKVPVIPAGIRRSKRHPSGRTMVIVGASITLISLIGVTTWRALSNGRAPRVENQAGLPREAAPMVVLPFTATGSESSQSMVQGVRGLLISYLDAYVPTRCVDVRLVDDALQVQSAEPINERRAQAFLARVGAERLLRGSLAVVGSSVHLEARLTVRTGKRTVSITRAAEGRVDELSQVVEYMARQLVVASFAGTDHVRLELSALDTPPLEALTSFQAGVSDESSASAADSYSRATQIDSAFALAWLHLASAQSGLGQAEPAASAFNRVLALGDRLGRRDRFMLEAFTAAMEVDIDRSERCYRQVLAEYPNDSEACV